MLAVVNAAIAELNRNPKSRSAVGSAAACIYILAAGRPQVRPPLRADSTFITADMHPRKTSNPSIEPGARRHSLLGARAEARA